MDTPQQNVVRWKNFHIKRLDEKMKTFDSGITIVFKVINVSSRGERHLKLFDNRHYGYLYDIPECDFESFKIVVFDVITN